MERFNNNQLVANDFDSGPAPCTMNIRQMTIKNPNYRTALWTGHFLQLTVMSIPVGGDIGLEVHPDTDQFLRIESGSGKAVMGPDHNNLTFQCFVSGGDAIFVPAGTWHNLINSSNRPLKLYTVYAPPHHPHGAVHVTKQQAEMEENH